MGKKRKKSKSSPQITENTCEKRLAMANNNLPNNYFQQLLQDNGQYQTMGQTGTNQGSQQFVSSNQQSHQTFSTPVNNYSPVGNMGSPNRTYYIPNVQSPNIPITTNLNSDHFSTLMQRFDRIETKLSQLDIIQSTVSKITSRLDSLDQKVKGLESKMVDIETSRNYDSSCLTEISEKQKYMDTMISKMKNMENDLNIREKEMKADITDLKGRSMRDNLLFFGIEEEKGEKDSDCCAKVLSLIEEKLGHENATEEIKLHRAHRIGKFKPSNNRPIVAKFAYFPDRERVRMDAKKLKRPYGISQQFPNEVMERRRKLIPIMLDARKAGKESYLVTDKLYIDGRLYNDETSGLR